jgi:hypothetical protein
VGARDFSATVGAVDEKMVMAYIKNQKWARPIRGSRYRAG